jgi:hypothetical protein
MNNNHEPYIFILDLDGTIIGDCSYQCDIYNIQEIIRKNIILKNTNIQLVNLAKYKTQCDKNLEHCYNLQSKLLRPHFATFMSEMRKRFPNSFFFIYTASEKTWANKEILIIEKQNNIKFNRPIFTRDNCIKDSAGNIKKSVNKILPQLLKALKIPKTQAQAMATGIINRLIIIDNNPTFIDYTDHLLLCPTYDYLKFHNLWENIPLEYAKITELRQFVSRLIASKKMYVKNNPTNSVILEKLHRWLYRKYKKVNKYNSKYNNDSFWLNLATLIKHHNITAFNKKNITLLQKSI